MQPTKPSTPSEYAVITVASSALLIVLGLIALVLGFLAPPDKSELAAAAYRYGAWSLGFGVAIAVGFWLFRRLTD